MQHLRQIDLHKVERKNDQGVTSLAGQNGITKGMVRANSVVNLSIANPPAPLANLPPTPQATSRTNRAKSAVSRGILPPSSVRPGLDAQEPSVPQFNTGRRTSVDLLELFTANKECVVSQPTRRGSVDSLNLTSHKTVRENGTISSREPTQQGHVEGINLPRPPRARPGSGMPGRPKHERQGSIDDLVTSRKPRPPPTLRADTVLLSSNNIESGSTLYVYCLNNWFALNIH